MADTTTAPLPLRALLRHLRDPFKLRFLLTLLVGVGWYFGVYMTFSQEVELARQGIAREQRIENLAVGVEQLKKQVERFDDRVPPMTDINEWVQYLLAGTRQFPIHLTTLDPQPTTEAPPYVFLRFKIDVEGSYADLDDFLHWIEDNPRLLRIDSITVTPIPVAKTNGGGVVAQLMVLGIMTKSP